MRYGASIDAVAYGQMDERPAGLDPSWVLRTERDPTVSDSYDVVAERIAAMEERLVSKGWYPHGYTIPENPDGTYGPAEVQYWGPPEEKGPNWGLIVGAGAAGLSVIGIVLAIVES